MTNPFPIETQKIFEEPLALYENLRNYLDAQDPEDLLADIVAAYKETARYGFSQALRTGNFAPWLHEREDLERITSQAIHYNCTTIVPTLYCHIYVMGLRDIEIFQFQGLRDTPFDEEAGQVFGEHFSLLVTIDGLKYLADPFHRLFGAVIEEGDNYWIIEDEYQVKKIKRNFGRLVHWDVNEFKEFMDHLRTPAGSLDMLLVRQKFVRRAFFANIESEAFISYDESNNVLQVRLHASPEVAKDRVIDCKTYLDDDGNVVERTLDLYLTGPTLWGEMKEPFFVARTTLEELLELKELVESAYKEPLPEGVEGMLETLPMFRPIYLAADPEKREEMDRFISRVFTRLLEDDRSTMLGLFIAIRTYYEAQAEEEHYHSTTEVRERWLSALTLEVLGLQAEIASKTTSLITSADIKTFTHMSNISTREDAESQPDYTEVMRDLPPEFTHDVLTSLVGLEQTVALKELKKLEFDYDIAKDELEKWRPMHDEKPFQFHRLVDLSLFGKRIEDLGGPLAVADLAASGEYDCRLGYMAMLLDFVPLALAAREELELTPYLDNLRPKIKARR